MIWNTGSSSLLRAGGKGKQTFLIARAGVETSLARANLQNSGRREFHPFPASLARLAGDGGFGSVVVRRRARLAPRGRARVYLEGVTMRPGDDAGDLRGFDFRAGAVYFSVDYRRVPDSNKIQELKIQCSAPDAAINVYRAIRPQAPG